MQPETFLDANRTLIGEKGVADLPAYAGDGYFITRWRPSLRERLSVFLFGNIWVALIGAKHPSIALAGGRGAHFQLPEGILGTVENNG